MSNAAGPLALVGLILVGIVVLWARQVVYRDRVNQYQDAVRLVLSIAGSLLILVGILGATTHMLYVLAPVGALVVLGVVLMLVMRYRSLERRSLLKCIAVAAEKGVPLDQAVRGFARERTDELGYRAALLAEALEAGTPLPAALARAKTSFSTDALLAMRLGHETGTLGPAVTRVARPDEELDIVARSLFEKYLYLGAMVLVILGCVSFFMLKIAPVYERMFREFDLNLPALTRWSIAGSEMFTSYYLLLAPCYVILLAGFVAAGLHYVGLLPRDFPVVAWLTRRVDAALVMRSLALAVHCQWPLNKTIWLLARIYPKRSVARRLAAAGQAIDDGENWCRGLRRAGLVGHAEWTVLEAAQRVGNVEWALDEMADSSIRRMVYRSRLFLNVAFPLALLAFGILVAFFAIGFFSPLVSLIQALA